MAPRIAFDDPAWLGSPLTIGIEHALGGARAWLAADLSSAPSGRAVLGVTSYLGSGPRLTVVPYGPLAGAIGVPGAGHGSLVATLPAAAALAGRPLFLQWLVEDAGGPAGYSASEAVEMRLTD